MSGLWFFALAAYLGIGSSLGFTHDAHDWDGESASYTFWVVLWPVVLTQMFFEWIGRKLHAES